jgi:zinc transport system substrate-binding protein
MTYRNLRLAGLLAAGTLLLFSAQASTAAGSGNTKAHDHSHSHSASDKEIYKGYFEDGQIAPRKLTDWEGDWQSVFPCLMDGTLDPVMEHKAAHGDKSAEEYRAYYEIGYKTDVDRIEIGAEEVVFHRGETSVSASYESDGYEILTYKKGNRGVRFIFRKTAGDEGAPQFIQFSDHRIAPAKADHYHLYWGDDRAALLEEVTNWPTYYPSKLSGDEIVTEMTAH